MILGIGSDICKVTRIKKVRKKFPLRFETKILSVRERQELGMRVDKDAYLAKRFAAKEAIYKAFNFMNQKYVGWHDVEILNDRKSGAPVVHVRGKCLKKFEEKLESGNIGNIHLSLTDEYPYVMAYVIIEKIFKPNQTLLQTRKN